MGRTVAEEAALPLEIFYNDNYFKFPALASMCEQIIAVHQQKPKKILEIGKGNGFVSDFLKKSGYDVTTVDINPNLHPDVLGSVLELEQHFREGEFDLALCAEVLEHMPFEHFETALKQIAFACVGGKAIITLPRAQRIYLDLVCDVKLTLWRFRACFTPDVFLSRRVSRISTSHHWEIDHSRETRMANIQSSIRKSFAIEAINRVRHCSYHRLFLLRSLSAA